MWRFIYKYLFKLKYFVCLEMKGIFGEKIYRSVTLSKQLYMHDEVNEINRKIE